MVMDGIKIDKEMFQQGGVSFLQNMLFSPSKTLEFLFLCRIRIPWHQAWINIKEKK